MVSTVPGPFPPTRHVALDSLRGVVAMAIMFFHMGKFGWIAGLQPFRSGWMLVEFFFVLSGFVITASYGSRLAHGYSRTGFMLVRFGRVYPLHILTVALFVLLELLVFRPILHEAHPAPVLVRAVLLLDVFRTHTGDFYAPVSWAVAVELALYALAALLFGRGRWALAIALALAGTSAWALWSGFNVPFFGRLLQRGLLGFAIGVACYGLHRAALRREPGTALLTIAEVVLVDGLIWMLMVPGKSNAWLIGFDLLFAAIVLVFARDRGLVSRALHWRPLVRLGHLSFALYMVHLFFIILPGRFLPLLFKEIGRSEWVRPGQHSFGLESVAPPQWLATLITLAIAALAIATAWLAWRFVEEPARNWTRRLVPPVPTPVVPAI